MRDPKRDLKRGRVFTLLNGGDGLARHAHLVAQIALRHFAGEEAQRPYIVGEGCLRHRVSNHAGNNIAGTPRE